MPCSHCRPAKTRPKCTALSKPTSYIKIARRCDRDGIYPSYIGLICGAHKRMLTICKTLTRAPER